MDTANQLGEIKCAYASVMRDWLEEYRATGNMRHDAYLVDWRFKSTIQRNLWSDIRDTGLPLYPKMPARGYFIDFANPFLKIGIECNANTWFGSEKGRIRNARLADDGWMIFRLDPRECARVTGLHSGEDEPPLSEEVYYYYMPTSEGLLRAMGWAYFGIDFEHHHEWMIRETLRSHRTTPETSPHTRDVVRRQLGPKRIGDLMPEFLELLERRMMGRT